MEDFDYRFYLYTMYMESDVGRLKSKKCDVVNNNISSHLCEVGAFIHCSEMRLHKRFYAKSELFLLFEKAVLAFKKCYVEETGYEPGACNSWIETINTYKEAHYVPEDSEEN